MTQLIKNQKKAFVKTFKTAAGQSCRIVATVRYDDECGNGHNSFAITGEIYEGRRLGSCGCVHEDIAKHFPELRPFLKWHLTSSDGPIHYLANTLYHAGDRDCHGKRKGEVWATATAITFGLNPIKHQFKPRFMKYLQGLTEYDLEIFEIPHKNNRPTKYDFDPKYTIGTFDAKWYQCPFDTLDEAEAFIYALQNCAPHFVTIATSWGEGKEPELDKARNSAIWPDATLEQLQDEAALIARLPALLAEFRKDVEKLGFTF